jgi:5-formaminoimidazole-4-carboxamide-1-(beta)-D-ribofuranosyl 5'-monophosphate synthetase
VPRSESHVPFDLAGTLASYDANALTLCSIGSHSALEVAAGARAQGLKNLIVTERGRNATYDRYYARRADGPPRGCVDATLELARFADLLDDGVQERLRRENVVFVPNRSFEVYLHQRYSYAEIEDRMRVPFLGNRRLLRAEERDEPDNQYALMERAGIRYPRRLASPDVIDTLVMVKAPHAKVSFERAFFLARTEAEYQRTAEQLIASGIVSPEGLRDAVIEEFALGPTINLNFFWSPVLGELELMGTDMRRQTNRDGLIGLPFNQARDLADEPMRMEEAGHVAATLTESMLEKAFDLGERFVTAARAVDGVGVIGPFALQCVIVSGPPKDFVVYDVSLRIPGSPGTRYTPYSAYRWGRDVSVGERIAMELVWARDAGRLADVLT